MKQHALIKYSAVFRSLRWKLHARRSVLLPLQHARVRLEVVGQSLPRHGRQSSGIRDGRGEPGRRRVPAKRQEGEEQELLDGRSEPGTALDLGGQRAAGAPRYQAKRYWRWKVSVYCIVSSYFSWNWFELFSWGFLKKYLIVSHLLKSIKWRIQILYL